MKTSIPVLAIVFLFVSIPTANADKVAGPRSYRKVTLDGSFVFVMLAPYPSTEEVVASRDPEVRAIRELYEESGLYPNDGSDTPIWTVDWYEDVVELARDNEHLIRTNTSPYFDRTNLSPTRYERVVLSFYDRGKLLRSFRVDELIADPWLLPHSVSHYQWLNRKVFDEANLHYEVWTQEGSWFEFDAATGQIVAQARVISPSTRRVWWTVAVAFSLVSISAWFVWWKKRQPLG